MFPLENDKIPGIIDLEEKLSFFILLKIGTDETHFVDVKNQRHCKSRYSMCVLCFLKKLFVDIVINKQTLNFSEVFIR